MSKKNNLPQLSWGNGYVCDSEIQNRIVGRVFGIVELIGLTDKQEESAKDLIRKSVWDSFDNCPFISPKAHSEIKEWYFTCRADADKNKLPMNELKFTICPE